ncbi:uncharacterized protein FOMMEDRAFT_90782 [Fomitiporia mediterranea MF3/22]|uniref:uncharacterized protein n=1 Tax=Fomitiporia mediterranea (strain MF3/22) TaxID=694068 RepID=UPI0004407CD3|nr:uncharacterized protein FOMMEDRAFT_90782 [Fomitiporia mediterranea MF3/22]EJD00281.1 hypothetical protein FOMMEDRAFT_90782 [Fomitiporia mediterranea MF3/22]
MSEVQAETTVDLEILVDLEQQYEIQFIVWYCSRIGQFTRFYDVGYKDGVEHGKIHGRIEGRELGREKGFEMWEELGFYEGFAKFWDAASHRQEGKDSRVSHNAQLLLDLITQFPMENPAQTDSADIDIPKLFNQIRARYKMLCAIMGVKPSLRVAAASQMQTREEESGASSTVAAAEDGGVKTQVVPMKKASVWPIESSEDSGRVDFSF